jgi:hypothetical protein
MDTLRSKLFRGDSKLLAALNNDASHITLGASGDHVKKIQKALLTLLRNPPVNIAQNEMSDGLYGSTTAAAVLRYKTEKNIVNKAYQTRPDDIVGKMTMKSLDESIREAQIALAVLGTIQHLDLVLVQTRAYLSPALRKRIEALRRSSATVAGAEKAMDDDVALAFYEGIRYIDENTLRTPLVAQAVSPSGVIPWWVLSPAEAGALESLAALGGITVLVILAGKLISDILFAKVMEDLDENERTGNRIEDDVKRCFHSISNPKIECIEAFRRFMDAKFKLDEIRGQARAQTIRIHRSLVTTLVDGWIWRALVRSVFALTKELSRLAREVKDACGCR